MTLPSPPMLESAPAPAGLTLTRAAGVRVAEGGRVLVGGSPPRLLRLSDDGATLAIRWFDGAPVGGTVSERNLARRLLDAGMVHPRPSAGLVGAQVWCVMPVRDEPGTPLVASAAAAPYPAIVVDDGSATPVSHGTPNVEVIRRTTSGGPGVARNDGAWRAHELGAEFVAFVDADVDAHAGWIDDLLGHFLDPMIAAVAPRVRAAYGTTALQRYEATFPSLDLGAEPSLVGPGRSVSYVPSAALIVRTAAFAAIGGFDADLRFGEDVDLVWRLVAEGQQVRYEPRVEVWHRARDDWKSWRTQRQAYGSSAAALATRHGEAVAPARAPFGVYVATASALVAPAPVAVGLGAVELIAADHRVKASLGEHHDPTLVRAGLVAAARTTALACVRAWLPFTGAAVLAGRRLRRGIVGLVIGAVVAEAAASPRHLGWIRTVGLRVLDHGAYGIGVWQGLRRVGRRGMGAIRPAVSRRGVRAD